MFHSYLNYVTTVWEKTRIPQKLITILKEKGLRITSFLPFNSHSSPYFYYYNILTFLDIVNIEARASISNCLNSNSFSEFARRLKLVPKSHAHNTRS